MQFLSHNQQEMALFPFRTDDKLMKVVKRKKMITQTDENRCKREVKQ